MDHLISNNQTYFEHLYDSWSFCKKSLKASFYFFIHGLIPSVFTHNGSATIILLNEELVKRLEKESE